MQSTVESDAQFGDSYIDFAKTGKRLVRATLKTYDNSGTYVFLKLFKLHQYSGEFVVQRNGLTLAEFDQLAEKSNEIKQTKKQHKSKTSSRKPDRD